MKELNKYIDNLINGFQKKFGRGSAFCLNPINIIKVLTAVINKYTIKHDNSIILIIVDKYETYLKIKHGLNNEIINLYNCKLQVITKNYIYEKIKYRIGLCITIDLYDEDYNTINKLVIHSNFMLSLFTMNKPNEITNIRQILHDINTEVNLENIKKDIIYSPVEEYIHGVDLNDEDLDKYEKYTNYINDCMAIFQNIETIEKCKKGDIKNNISSTEFRYQLAINNGWNEKLDVNIEYQKEIDEIYNPNSLLERACNFYNIVRERQNLITDNTAKLYKIKEICENNKDSKILILSKKGTFASTITNYLNKNNIECKDYHDCIENAYIVDINGEIIKYKSGVNKGKPKIFGSQAISSYNLEAFNRNLFNILSIKNNSYNSLKCEIDILIITSSLCDDIFEIKTRFNHLHFKTIPNKVYLLICNNTIEQNKLHSLSNNSLIKRINENENNLLYDEKSGDIIL